MLGCHGLAVKIRIQINAGRETTAMDERQNQRAAVRPRETVTVPQERQGS